MGSIFWCGAGYFLIRIAVRTKSIQRWVSIRPARARQYSSLRIRALQFYPQLGGVRVSKARGVKDDAAEERRGHGGRELDFQRAEELVEHLGG